MKDENKILAHEVTPPSVYFNRRNFIRAGILAASVVATGVVYRKLNPVGTDTGSTAKPPKIADVRKLAVTQTNDASGFAVNEKETAFENITHYNNFYEFSTDKEGVATAAAKFKTADWKVSVGGAVNKPKTFALDDIL